MFYCIFGKKKSSLGDHKKCLSKTHKNTDPSLLNYSDTSDAKIENKQNSC